MNDRLSEDFVLQLIKFSLKSKDNFLIVKQHLKLEFLPDETLQKLWKGMVAEFNVLEQRTVPSTAILTQVFRKEHEIIQIISDIKELKPDVDEAILNQFEYFIKLSNFISAHSEVADVFNKGQHALAMRLWDSKQLSNFSLKGAKIETVFGDFNKRMIDRAFDKNTESGRARIPFLIDELDRYTKGYETGEFVLIMGDSGSGKSFLGNHIGIAASRFGVEVFHVQAEGTKKQVMNRYDSAFTGTTYFDVKNLQFTEKNLQIARNTVKNMSGEIHVEAPEQFGAMTMLNVRQRLIDLKRFNDIKVVIIDYIDLLNPGDKEYSAGEERFRQQAVAKMCKNLAMEQDVAVIGFTQASSISPEDLNNPNFVITRFNIAEDKGKIRPVDLFITINRTNDEAKQNHCRLYIDKAREYKGRQTVHIVQNLDKSRFYDKKKTAKTFFNPDEDEE